MSLIFFDIFRETIESFLETRERKIQLFSYCLHCSSVVDPGPDGVGIIFSEPADLNPDPRPEICIILAELQV
jgi:hypothetical protein